MLYIFSALSSVSKKQSIYIFNEACLHQNCLEPENTGKTANVSYNVYLTTCYAKQKERHEES